jgi:hypothetical protein
MDKFKFFFSSVWGFLKPLITMFLTKAGLVLMELAEYYVKNLTYSDLTNDEKRKTAFSLIKKDLEAKGFELAESFINAAIEAAVVKLKDK